MCGQARWGWRRQAGELPAQHTQTVAQLQCTGGKHGGCMGCEIMQAAAPHLQLGGVGAALDRCG